MVQQIFFDSFFGFGQLEHKASFLVAFSGYFSKSRFPKPLISPPEKSFSIMKK